MRKVLILFLVCLPLLFGLFSSAAAFNHKVSLSECFTATW